MAQVTIYKPADVTVTVIDGEPPVDQSAEVAALQAQVQSLTAENTALQVKIANAQAALA
jgi:ethanolamine utilization cobalamin adenosyltransferase